MLGSYDKKETIMIAGTLIPLLGFITLSFGLAYGVWRYLDIKGKADGDRL